MSHPTQIDFRPCRACSSTGRVPLSRSTQAVLNYLRERRTALSVDVAAAVGLSHQRADGCLIELRDLGYATRDPARTAQGFEWRLAPHE